MTAIPETTFAHRVPIESLLIDPRNARAHPDANRAAVRASLAEHGQVEAVVVQTSTRRIIGGNCRVEELVELGVDSVWVHEVDCDDTTADRLALRLNRTAELAGWHTDLLSEILAEQAANQVDLTDLGWGAPDLDDLPTWDGTAGAFREPAGEGIIEGVAADIGEIEDEPAVPPVPREPVTKPGEIVTLGRHVLHCGDCVEVMAGMEAESVDAIVTDPPYGLSDHGGEDAAHVVHTALAKAGFPDLVQRDAEFAETGSLLGVAADSAPLRGIDRAVWVDARVSVPERTVDLDGAAVDHEVNDADETSMGAADPDLSVEFEAQPGQYLGDFILQVGAVEVGPSGDPLRGNYAETFAGGFAMAVGAVLTPGDPDFLGGSTPVIRFGGLIGAEDDSLGEAESTPGVVTLPRAVDALVLRFDTSGRPLELRATRRARKHNARRAFGGPALVRACAAASCLATVAEPCRVRLVCSRADGADSGYWLHVWIPKSVVFSKIVAAGGFMGKQWDATLPDPEAWRETMRVLKPGGHVVAFGGTRTVHRLTCALEDAGFEIRDMGAWITFQGFPKSLDISKAIDKAAGAEREIIGVNPNVIRSHQSTSVNYENNTGNADITAPATEDAKRWQGYGTALKPSQEPWILARKPLIGTVAANVLAHGTGALNIDATRFGYGDPMWVGPKDGYGRTAAGSDGVVRSYDGLAGSATFAIRDRESDYAHTLGRWPANLVYCPKPSTAEREAGAEELKTESETRGNNHVSVKPLRLMRWLARLVTPPGGTICEPYAGSGTTLLAAQREGFDCIAIEQNPGYCDIVRARFEGIED